MTDLEITQRKNDALIDQLARRIRAIPMEAWDILDPRTADKIAALAAYVMAVTIEDHIEMAESGAIPGTVRVCWDGRAM